MNHCVLAGNAYQKAVEIALEITKQVCINLLTVYITRCTKSWTNHFENFSTL